MSKSMSFELDQFPNGYFLAWEVLTQCYNTVNINLKVGGTTYFDVNKTNNNTALQLISQNSKDHISDYPPILTITVNESTQLKQSVASGAINDQKAKKVGYSYSFCIEDGTDDDYNDVYVNIVGWAKKG